MITRRVALTALVASETALAAEGNPALRAWRESMDTRWAEAETYTLEVLSAMPEERLTYSPVPEEFTFAKHLTHLAFYNVFLLSAITRKGPPSEMAELMASWKEPQSGSKRIVRGFLESTFRRSREITSGLDESALRRRGIKPGEDFTSVHSGEELVWRALTHTFHHRGQAIVYLRMNNIAAPRYRF